MTDKPVIPRQLAHDDILNAVDHYRTQADPRVVQAFIDALQQAFRHIARHPAAGTARLAHELDLPGLRAWPIRRHPYWIFYHEAADHIDIWRILHGSRDIPSSLQEPGA